MPFRKQMKLYTSFAQDSVSWRKNVALQILIRKFRLAQIITKCRSNYLRKRGLEKERTLNNLLELASTHDRASGKQSSEDFNEYFVTVSRLTGAGSNKDKHKMWTHTGCTVSSVALITHIKIDARQKVKNAKLVVKRNTLQNAAVIQSRWQENILEMSQKKRLTQTKNQVMKNILETHKYNLWNRLMLMFKSMYLLFKHRTHAKEKAHRK